MSIKKKYLKSKAICKVSFEVPKEAAKDAKKVVLVGEFNGWDTQSLTMKRLKNGKFTSVVDLEPGKEYQFRYLFDDKAWENDWAADKYVRTDFGDCENSVVVV